MINVLVIDDSAVVREGFTQLLSRQADMSLATARDPIVAFEKMKRQRPDVIVLDLEMPRMDGLTFLRTLTAEDPIPVIVCSGFAEAGTPRALQAIEIGAVDIIEKPRFGVRDFLQESASLLVDSIRGAARARLRRAERVGASAPILAADLSGLELIAIGASTGGPSAIRQILRDVSAAAPPVVVVQHMAKIFTPTFARWLNECCAMEVREAKSGDPLRRGTVLIAPGGRHIRVARNAGALIVRLEDEPLELRHRPSVDVLFHSVAATGARAAGILLTGMGADGAAGLLAMRTAGSITIAQDEASSVVFGMPREAIVRGAASAVLPLDSIAAALAS